METAIVASSKKKALLKSCILLSLNFCLFVVGSTAMASDHFYSQNNDHPSSLIKCPLQLLIRNFFGFLNFLPDQASLRIHLDNPCWIQLASNSNPGTSSCQSGGYSSQLSGFFQLAFEFVDMQITLSRIVQKFQGPTCGRVLCG